VGRFSNFRTGQADHTPHKDIQDYLGPSKASTEPDDDFAIPAEQRPYYDAYKEGQAHREKMAGMSVAERNQYNHGLREGLKQDDRPKRGDIDNPLRKDMPKQPAAPRQARAQRPPSPMVKVRKMQGLARKASGKRR
jgi:hypothetical protein